LRSTTDACCSTGKKTTSSSRCTNISPLGSTLKDHDHTDRQGGVAAKIAPVQINDIYVPPHRRTEEIASTEVYQRKEQLQVGATIMLYDTRNHHNVQALIDSGCTSSAISREFVVKHKINTTPIPHPVPVYNADGTRNQDGDIKEYVELSLDVKGHRERINLMVTGLKHHHIFLGMDWLTRHNPDIDWITRKLQFTRCPKDCEKEFQEPIRDNERMYYIDTEAWLQQRAEHIRLTTNISTDLAARAEAKKKHKDWEEVIPPFYHQFEKVFTREEFDELPPKRPWDHAIELIPGAKPADCKIYPLSLSEQKELETFLDEHLATGRIRVSKSPMASPFFFVKKKDGRLRPVQDYRKLNDITIKNRYPLPLIAEVLDELKDARIFTKIDIRWGYNNVRIKEGDEWKAAFRTNRGLFEPLVMFFGLTNSPATFQTMMNHLFYDLISEGHVRIYMDDILIFTKDIDSHRIIVTKVLQILADNKLYLKPEKCDWEASSVEYLGMIVSEGEVRMDPLKVAAVEEWPTPKNKKDVQTFLGFINFYRRFIRRLGSIAKPLTSLTGKNPWEWGLPQQEAFDQLKKQIVASPVLAIPQDEGKYKLETDASDFAKGAVLYQQQKGQWKIVGFMSDAMNPAERNYEVYDKELLAIVEALKKWRKQLLGAQEDFEIWTDHKNLQYFRAPQNVNRRQARWIGDMAEYHFTIHHLEGGKNKGADALSRRPDHDDGSTDNKEVTILPEHWFRLLGAEDILTQPTTIMEEVTSQMQAQGRQGKFWERLKKKYIGEWTEDEKGLKYWRNRVFIPKGTIRTRILKEYHDSTTAGHPGQHRMHENIFRTFWWPTLRKDIRTYIEGCSICQRTRLRHRPPPTTLQPSEIPTQNWQRISVDLIGPLPRSQDYDAIMVVVDYLSKMAHFLPCDTTLTGEGAAKMYLESIFKLHGIAESMTSDRGPQFASKFATEFKKLIGTESRLSTAYRPETDGQTEATNKMVEQYLRRFSNYEQDDWAEWLPLAEFTYNDHAHSATGHSPFYLNYGHHPWKGLTTIPPSPNESATEFVTRMHAIREEAQAALRYTQEDMKRFHSREQLLGTRIFLFFSFSFLLSDKSDISVASVIESLTSALLVDKRNGDPSHIRSGVPLGTPMP
jgi:phosphoglycolate phosphatase-like HAD superfamily hydrolase